MPDWAPLADDDPVPGDPAGIAALAGRLRTTAEAVRTQGERVRLVRSDAIWDGDAARVFEEHQRKLPPRLVEVDRRFGHVSAALDDYHPRLADAQMAARRARSHARQAEADIHTAQRGLVEMHAEQAAAAAAAAAWNGAHPTEPARAPAPWTGPDYPALLARTQADLDAARSQLRRAEHARDEAAHRCAGAIRQAIADQLADDHSVWAGLTRLGHELNDALPAIAHSLARAGAVIGLLSIAIPALAPVTLGLTAVALVADTVLAAQHRGSWTTVALDAVAVAGFGAAKAGAVAGDSELLRVGVTTTDDVALNGTAAVKDAARTGAGAVGRATPGAADAERLASAHPFDLPPGETWGRADTLADHALRHGADFDATTEDAYADEASRFLQRGLQDRVPIKVRPQDGSIRMYDPATNTFGAYNADGTTRTFYKPDPAQHGYQTNWEYWLSQPGEAPWSP